ncbi:hypothetical protein SMITH_26 [Smithella sp. ME-1]|nr:hypothetical protein SMITH_26 [Smithella sp. ME-1]
MARAPCQSNGLVAAVLNASPATTYLFSFLATISQTSENLDEEGAKTTKARIAIPITQADVFTAFLLNNSRSNGTRRTKAALREPERAIATERIATIG